MNQRAPDLSVLLFVFAVSLISAFTLRAEEAAGKGDRPNRTAYCPRVTLPPNLDGALDDRCWLGADVQSAFFVLNSRFPFTTKTEVMSVRDDRAIYFGIRAYSYDLNRILTRANKRDSGVWEDDSVEIFLQSSEAGAPYYHFILNSAGTLYDSKSDTRARDWNPEIEVACTKKRLEGKSGCWSAEIAIPWKVLAIMPKDNARWRANFTRTDSNRGELSTWMNIESGGFEQPERFGLLVFRKPTEQEIAQKKQYLREGESEQKGKSGDVKPLFAIPLDSGASATLKKLAVSDCRVIRAFVGEPVDGCVRSSNYSGRVSEYPSRYVGAGINYSYGNNDGLHITLADDEGFDAVVLRGGARTDMFSDATDLADPGTGKLLWRFSGEGDVEVAFFEKRVKTKKVSFFETRGGMIADVAFYRIDLTSQTKKKVEAWTPRPDAVALAKPAKKFAPESLFLGMNEFYEEGDRSSFTLFKDRALTLAPKRGGGSPVSFKKGQALHFISESFGVEKGLKSIGVQAKPSSAQERLSFEVVVHDPLNPRRDLTWAPFSIESNKELSLTLDILDQALMEDSRLWLTLRFDADVTLSGPDGGSPLFLMEFTSRQDALLEAFAWRKLLMRTLFGQLSEPRPWGNFRKQPREEFFASSIYAGQCPEFFMTIDQCTSLDPTDDFVRQYREWVYLRNLDEVSEVPRPPEPPRGVPGWAWYPRLAWLEFRKMVDWWMTERLAPTGEVGVGVQDDTDFYQQFADLPYLERGGVAAKVMDACARLAELADKENLRDGLNIHATDSLHAYEEGINHLALMARWHYGDPIYLERCMVSARNMERLTIVTEDGRRHFRDRSRMGFKDIANPSKPAEDGGSTALLWHTSLQVADYNRNPRALKTLREWADSWLRFQKPGQWATVVDVVSGKVRSYHKDRPLSGGYRSQAVTFLWLYAMTKDKRYVAPFLHYLGRGTAPYPANTLMADFCALGVLDDLDPKVKDRLARVSGAAALGLKGDPTSLIQQIIGRPRNWHASIDNLMDARRFPDMYTSAHQYTDRVFLGDLQARISEAYLGGFCKRNKYNPTLAVSWEGFGTDYGAMVLKNRRDGLKVAVYNFSPEPLSGKMRVWALEHGRYTVATGIDENNDLSIDEHRSEFRRELKRADGIELNLAPKAATLIEINQESTLDPIYSRPDLAIAAREVAIKGSTLSGTVHNIGSADIQDVVVAIRDGDGKTILQRSLGPLPAPLDLTPRRKAFSLRLPRAPGKGWKLQLDPDDSVVEIYEGNNHVALGSLPLVVGE